MSEKRLENFTPGPWSAGRNPAFTTVLDGQEGKAIYNSDNYHVAWANAFDGDVLRIDTAIANAALIAAAPEMYAELKDLLDAMEAGLFPQAAPGVDYPSVMEKKWELRKLLKKARGEKP